MPGDPQDRQDQDDRSNSDSTEVQATSTTSTALTTTNTALATTNSSDADSSTDSASDSGTTTADRGDGDRMGGPGMQDYVDSVTSAANMKVTLEMILVGLALIAVSGTAAMSGVMKYDPLQILTTRD